MPNLNRRGFGKCSAAAALALSVGKLPAVHAAPASKLRVGFIGVGGRGGANLKAIGRDPNVQVTALCDVNRKNLEAAQKLYPDARSYVDFRVLHTEADDIDAFAISTAEHTHAYATAPVLRMGKHVYCEKPLTHNVAEARLITDLARQAGVATQMGTQIHSSDNYRRVVELVQGGAIGKVNEAHVWVGRAWGLQSKADAERFKDIVYVTERPTEAMTPPDYLEWDLWLGPAKERPFHEVYFPGPKWYRWWEFGNGTMSDLGSHWNDLPYWALKLDAPTRIEAEGDPPHPEIAPASMTAHYEYGQRGDLPPCRLTWYQGSHKPSQWIDKSIPQWNSGCLFVGDKGMLLSDYRKHVLLPEERFSNFDPPPQTIPSSPGHQQEWLAACREGSATGSHFGYAGPLTEANHLGNVAFRAAGPIHWDAGAVRITNNEAANRFLTRQPRAGWSLEE